MEENNYNDALASAYAAVAEFNAATYTDKQCAELKNDLAALRAEIKELKGNK